MSPHLDEMPFSLEWLAKAHTISAVTVCPAGHLVVHGRTHWEPLRLSADLRALWCRIADHTD